MFDVGAVLDEQPHALGKIPARRGPELLDEKPGRARESIAEAAIPGTAPVSAEPVLEEQSKVTIVFAEVPVVERLAVVRIRARIEEQARELVAAGMRRLTRSSLALAEGARERGEGRQVSLPQEAGVGIGSALEQETRDLECGSVARPLRGASSTHREGAPSRTGRPGAATLPGSASSIARAAATSPAAAAAKMLEAQIAGSASSIACGLRQVRSLPAPVVEARQAHERIGRGVRGVLDVGRRVEAKRRDGLDVALELRPARKSVGSREHQLRAAQGEPLGGGLPFRMELADSRQGLGAARSDFFEQTLRAVTEILERRVFGKRRDRHGDLLPGRFAAPGCKPAVRNRARKTSVREWRKLGWAWPFPRTGSAPRARR